jgi:hypothetical protein
MDSNDNPDEFLKKYFTWYVKVINNRFTLIDETGTWKVDQFILPF